MRYEIGERMQAWALEAGTWRCMGIVPACDAAPRVLKGRIGGVGPWMRDDRGWHVWTWRFRRAWIRLSPVKG